MKKISILVLTILMCSTAFGQSKTIKQFQKDTDGHKIFLYQSVIRVLNRNKNPDFNLLIKDLDHLRFVSSEATGPEAIATFQQIDQGVRSEGFEEILSFDNAENKCRIYELNSSKGKTTWVVTMLMEGMPAAIEMKGSLDLRYINALGSINMDKVSDLLPIDIKQKVKEEMSEEDMPEEEMSEDQ
ncbi:MAG: DUF4252 domain-containing protein [Bacteroidia bacterium]